MNFDTFINRRGTGSYKWDACPTEDTLPLWVADMDFPAAPCIREALQRRLNHGVFGYVRVPDSYYAALDWWYSTRHGWHIPREQVIPTIGVVPAFSAIIQALTRPGDKVLVQTPVYNCFFSSIRNAGCECVAAPLHYESSGSVAGYSIDFPALDRALSTPGVRLMLLCNPHNPAGRCWTEDELRRIGDLCARHDVFLISDEIHNGIVMPGHRYTPFATLGFTDYAVCLSPSKSFNIAGLQNAVIVCPDEATRQRIDKQININEVCDVNPFGVVAFEAAYSPEGAEWLSSLNTYIYNNYLHLLRFFTEYLPQLPVTRLEATYLVWINCTALLSPSSTALEEDLLQKARLWFNAGDMYDPSGSPFLRINIACPRSTLDEALHRFLAYVRKR